MEKQTNFNSLLSLLPEGKVESNVRLADTAVTGICTVYLSRADDEKEFLLRTIGVAALDGSNLTEAARIATDQAYSVAMRYLAGGVPSAMPRTQSSMQVPEPRENQILEPNPESSQPVSPLAGDINTNGSDNAAVTSQAVIIQSPPVDLRTVVAFPGEASADSGTLANCPTKGQENNGGIEKIEFVGTLFPESDTSDHTVDSTDHNNDIDPEYQKALDTEITIFGKANACHGWTAGKMLAEQPEMIVNFCNRNNGGAKYTGPKTDQVNALFMLYPDAVRKISNAA